MQSPMGHVLVHDRLEAIIVTPHDQVRHFMHDDVFEKLRRLLGQLGIETDAVSVRLNDGRGLRCNA